MPIPAPQWTDYLNCPLCCCEFGAPPRSPISLACGHTLCKHCLKYLHMKICPYDQTVIQLDPDELVVNTALLQLVGFTPPTQPYHPPSIQALSDDERQAYDWIVKSMEHLAIYLKYYGSISNNVFGGRLSRPMQRKLVMLLQCAVTDEEGRLKTVRAVRSLGERTVTEIILQHQNPQQLSANLWAAVRARGCQFLGPAMQEEVLKLVLLALEDDSALSRKVLVMFVVQRLEPHFPQASKTSIGHVVQLLYRASCFKVSKRECDSSLMQLKEEFRTYESLRREHDAQIVQIATEAGLRIAPDQWSALLYGDTAHKSHMQSIIDKLQTPQSFASSVQELMIALQRRGDPANLLVMSRHLERLAAIDASPDAKSPSWQELAEVMMSLQEVVAALIHYLQLQAVGRDANHNPKQAIPDRTQDTNGQPSPLGGSTVTHAKYRGPLCREATARALCPRGPACVFVHSEEELERYCLNQVNDRYVFVPLSVHGLPVIAPSNIPATCISSSGIPSTGIPPSGIPPTGIPPTGIPPTGIPPTGIPPTGIPPSNIPLPPGMASLPPFHHYAPTPMDHQNYQMAPSMVPVNIEIPDNHMNGQYPPHGGERPYYGHYNTVPRMPEDHRANAQFAPDRGQTPVYVPAPANTPELPCEMCVDQKHVSQEVMFNLLKSGLDSGAELMPATSAYGAVPLDRRTDAVWGPCPRDMYSFTDINKALTGPVAGPSRASPSQPASGRALGAGADDQIYNFSEMNQAISGPLAGPSRVSPSPLVNSRALGATADDHLYNFTDVPEPLPGPLPGPSRVSPIQPANSRAVGANRLAKLGSGNLEVVGADDRELEAGLQALERQIDTEFEMVD